MTFARILVIAVFLFVSPHALAKEPAPSHVRTVEQFVTAFNAHDSASMGVLVADDIEWLSISDDKVATETKGKRELLSSMDEYFTSCPTCQSRLSGVISTPGRVSAVEVASWQGKAGPKSQKSLSVYEFSNDLIRRVYYFPAEK